MESERLDDGLAGRLRFRHDWSDEHQSGSRFRFNCRIEPAGAKTKVSQTVEVGGPLGSVLGGMLGPQVSKEFGTLLSNLARKAETT